MSVSEAPTAESIATKIAQQDGVHALLLHGGDANGMTEIALKVANTWMCNQTSDGEPCGTCQVCRTIAQREAIDLLLIRPTGLSNWISVSVITPVPGAPASEVQPVTRFVQSTPLVARRKVVIIERADRLRVEAANALLKTLEEPTPRVKFILTTSAISAVLPTIASRCIGVLVGSGAGDAEATEWERIFSGGSSGKLAQIRAQSDAYRGLWEFLETLAPMGATQALLASERFRALSDGFDSAALGGARAVNVELLACLAQWLADRFKDQPELVKSAISAHGAVLGNGSMSLQTDPLFCQIMGTIAYRTTKS